MGLELRMEEPEELFLIQVQVLVPREHATFSTTKCRHLSNKCKLYYFCGHVHKPWTLLPDQTFTNIDENVFFWWFFVNLQFVTEKNILFHFLR